VGNVNVQDTRTIVLELYNLLANNYVEMTMPCFDLITVKTFLVGPWPVSRRLLFGTASSNNKLGGLYFSRPAHIKVYKEQVEVVKLLPVVSTRNCAVRDWRPS
jgi:hypothetical protein